MEVGLKQSMIIDWVPNQSLPQHVQMPFHSCRPRMQDPFRHLPSLFPCTASLSALRADLARCTLGLLLARDTTPNLSLSSLCRALGLLCLLLAFRRGLLLFGVLDGRLSRGKPGFWSLRSSLLDDVKRGADNGPLMLDGPACALLCYFLYDDRCVSTRIANRQQEFPLQTVPGR